MKPKSELKRLAEAVRKAEAESRRSENAQHAERRRSEADARKGRAEAATG